MKVELVELISNDKSDSKGVGPYTPGSKPLENIYRNDSLGGSHFSTEAYTRVSYHCRNPQMNDEIKVKLPNVISSKHWLKFTVVHCHVKPIATRTNILSNLIRPSVEKTLEDCIELGFGYLPIVTSGETLIEDSEYIILMIAPASEAKVGPPVLGNENFLTKSLESTITNTSTMISNIGHANGAAEVPFIRVRTKAFTSLFSSDKRVQAALKYYPIPLGILPSSLMKEECALQIIQNSLSSVPKEAKLITAIADLSKASSVEISRHFFTIMRELIRAMLAGTGVYDEFYVNPYKHNKVRCQGFLTMLQVIGKISNDQTNPSSTEETSLEKEFMNAYVDFIFDEEVPISTFNYFTQSVAINTLDDRSSVSVVNQHENSENSDSATSLNDKSLQDEAIDLHRYSRKVVKIDENPVSAESISIDIVENNKNSIDAEYQSESDEESLVPASEGTSPENSESKLPEDLPGLVKHESALHRTSSRQNVLVRTSSRINVVNFDAEALLESEKTNLTDAPSNENGFPMVKSDSSYVIDEGFEEDDAFLENQDIDEFNLLPQSPQRKSWGKYITDALWSSGGLLPLDQLDKEDAESSNVLFEYTMKYLDEVANHVTLQTERVIFEILIELSVHSISKQIVTKNSNDDYGIPLEEQNIIGKYRFKENYYQESEEIINQNIKFPFISDKSWFSAIDSGLYRDPRDISVGDMNENIHDSSCNIIEGVKKRSTTLNIFPVLPKYDYIEGFRDRTLRISGLKRQSEDSNCSDNLVGIQWWPWLYEVIIFQWVSVLTITLSSVSLISSTNTESIVGGYPFEQEHMVPKQKLTTSAPSRENTRFLLLEHGPILLKLIHKSLIYRLKREHKRPPILLDEQFFSALENLVMLLSVEIATASAGIWRSKRLNLSLITFLRSLFAVITPYQAIRLIRSYFRALRTKNKLEETDLRLQALENICLFDQMVAVNFPFVMDAPYAMFSFTLSALKGKPDTNTCLQFTAFGIRSTTSPAPYCLAHTIIGEIFTAYRQDDKKMKDSAIEILRNLLLKHACDARYNRGDAQERITCMYLPLIKEIIDQKNRLLSLKYDSPERKEILAILLYILQGIPRNVLRYRLRTLSCLPILADSDKRLSKRMSDPVFLREESLKLNAGNRSSVKSMSKLTKQDQDSSGFLPKTSFQELPIASLLMILHLALDTFEVPKLNLSSIGSYFNPSSELIAQQNALQLLSPNLTATAETDAALKRNTITSSQPAVVEGQMRAGNIATSLLQSLGINIFYVII